MSDDSTLAGRLFPSAAAEAAEGKQKPAPTRDQAARLFPEAAAEEPSTQQQQKPAHQQPKAEPAKDTDQAKPEAAPPAVAAIANALAGQAELGLAADHPDTASFSSVAAEIGLSGDKAVRLAQWDQERTAAAWERTAEEWLAEAKQDVLFDDDVNYGRAVLTEFGNDRLNTDINDMSLGNHPGLIKLLGKVGRALEQARRARR